MKKNLYLLLLFAFALTHAQKDHSLFWEISGNGLAKKSYLYGTMHVNEKISYRLSDAFFEHLLAADIVSNESNPESWGELIDLFEESEIGSTYKFYSEFYLSPIRKEALASVFVSTNYFNKTLEEMEGDRADFQESTVLDMFIFQAGKKYKKKVVGLEDAKASVLMLLQLKPEDMTPTEENKTALLKILKNKSYSDVLKQYYREKDVVMLDSLYKMMFSKKGHQALIVDRNAIMARSLDSLARTGSVFAGVGAAHLAGRQGIIQMLRDKGYTVKPITDQISEAGKAKKKAMEDFFPNPNFKLTTLDDRMLSMPLNNYLLVRDKEIASPDYASGAAITIKRMPLNDYLKKDAKRFDPEILDSLFFENIPGEILDKKFFETASYKGYDIKNVTKIGNNQHYRFYITPLELIAISMVGNGNYVRQYEASVFDKIKIKPFAPTWEKFKPGKGGFTVELPSYHMVYGNDAEKVKNLEIQAYDDSEKAYYFLIEKTLDDTNRLEETAYEHQQIHQEFYQQHRIDTLKTAFEKDGLVSESLLGNRKIRLKSVIKGAKYYLLGTVNASEKNSGRFFRSFATEPFRYTAAVKTYTDTIAHFKIDIPEKTNTKLFLHLEDKNHRPSESFNSGYRSFDFLSESGKSVRLEYNRSYKYKKPMDLDSLRVYFRKEFLRDYGIDSGDYEGDDEYMSPSSLLNSTLYTQKGFKKSTWNSLINSAPEKYEMLSENESFDKETNIRTFDAVVSKPKSDQAIRYRVLWRPDSYYLLKTLIDKNNPTPDPFIEKTFSSFVFAQPFTATSSNKIKDFIDDVKSEKDTIRQSALRSVYTLELERSDFDALSALVDTFEFKTEENNSLAYLLIKMGDINDERIVTWLEKIYQRKQSNSEVKLAVLSALAKQKTKNAYKKILELMEEDLPLSESQFDLITLFDHLADDPENGKILLPAVFQFYKTEEYKSPVIGFCQSLLDSGQITVKNLSPFKKTVLADANLKYKRFSDGSKSSYEDESELGYSSSRELIEYVDFLSRFPKDKEIEKLFNNLKALDDTALKVEMLRLGITNQTLSENEIKSALEAPTTRFLTLQLLLNKNDRSIMDLLTDAEIAAAAVFNFNELAAKDTVTLLEKRIVQRKGKNTTYYFYRVKTSDDEEEKTLTHLHTIAFVNDSNRINPEAFQSIAYGQDVADDALEEFYKTTINESLNESHPRASFGKSEVDGEDEEIISSY